MPKLVLVAAAALITLWLALAVGSCSLFASPVDGRGEGDRLRTESTQP